MSDHPVEIKPAYAGEALLLRWGDSASSGRTVTLQISEDDLTHPFKGLKCGSNGQRMEIVCVLKDDDETPQNPDHARKPETNRVKLASVLIKENDAFKNWLVDTYWTGKEAVGDYDALLKRVLGIGSKKELDLDPAAGERFDRLVTTFHHRDRVRA